MATDLTDKQRAALAHHGYDPDARPRGVSGGPATFDMKAWVDGQFVTVGKLRNHVCFLDGVVIDGHEGSDLDPGGGCIHCQLEWAELRERGLLYYEGDDEL